MLLKLIDFMMSCLDKLVAKLLEAQGFLKTCKLGVYNKMLETLDKEIRATHVEMWLLDGKAKWLDTKREDIKVKIKEL